MRNANRSYCHRNCSNFDRCDVDAIERIHHMIMTLVVDMWFSKTVRANIWCFRLHGVSSAFQNRCRLKWKMFCRQLLRSSLNNFRQFATEASPLAVLRKKTGYSFVNCKKALELHNNDCVKVSRLKISARLIDTFLTSDFRCRQSNGFESKLSRWAGQRQPNWKDE